MQYSSYRYHRALLCRFDMLVKTCSLNYFPRLFPVLVNYRSMAKSCYEYVKQFELENKCLLNSWIIVRVDGKNFHRFSDHHNFDKPNDSRGLNLMNRAAASVVNEFRDIVLAYGQSDEYSFVFRRGTDLYNRRSDKITSLVVSLFTSSYVFHWKDYLPKIEMKYPPSFDGRAVLYPTDENLRDYLSWRQADTHVNNLYNTCFWLLVLKKHLTNTQAEEKLRGTTSADKNELLFSEFNLNYNNEPPMYRKGTTLVRKTLRTPDSQEQPPRLVTLALHCDIIRETFWKENPELLSSKTRAKKVPEIDYSEDLVFYEFKQKT